MAPFEMKKIGRIFLVMFVLLAGACAGPSTQDESFAVVQENMREWQREQIAAGKGDYMASVYTPLNAQKYDEAIEACEEIREIRPNDHAVFIAEGLAYHRKGELSIAINRFSSAIPIDNASIVPYFLRAQSYFKIGWYEKSLGDIKKTLGSQDFSTQLVNFYRKVDGETNKGLTEETIKGIIYQYQAFAYNRVGQEGLAIASADNAIRAIPTDANLYYTRGVLYREHRNYAAAYNDFEKAIELNPGSAENWNSAGALSILLGRYNNAVIHLQKATELDPENVGILTNYSFAQWLKGDQIKAFEIMGRAMRGEPNFTTFYHLAYFHHANGRQDKALEYYTKAYELNRDVLAVRASTMNATPASSPTRKFYEEELDVATRYIEQGKTPAQIANDNRPPKLEITGIHIDPNPVPVNTAFDFHVSFNVDIPGSRDATIATTLHFEVLRSSKILLTSEPYSINASNGQTKKWTLHMNPVRAKGSYTIRVFIKHKDLASEKSMKLLIN